MSDHNLLGHLEWNDKSRDSFPFTLSSTFNSSWKQTPTVYSVLYRLEAWWEFVAAGLVNLLSISIVWFLFSKFCFLDSRSKESGHTKTITHLNHVLSLQKTFLCEGHFYHTSNKFEATWGQRSRWLEQFNAAWYRFNGGTIFPENMKKLVWILSEKCFRQITHYIT